MTGRASTDGEGRRWPSLAIAGAVLASGATQIGLIVAPIVLRWLRSLGDDVDQAAEAAFEDSDTAPNQPHKEEHTNGTRR